MNRRRHDHHDGYRYLSPDVAPYVVPVGSRGAGASVTVRQERMSNRTSLSHPPGSWLKFVDMDDCLCPGWLVENRGC